MSDSAVVTPRSTVCSGFVRPCQRPSAHEEGHTAGATPAGAAHPAMHFLCRARDSHQAGLWQKALQQLDRQTDDALQGICPGEAFRVAGMPGSAESALRLMDRLKTLLQMGMAVVSERAPALGHAFMATLHRVVRRVTAKIPNEPIAAGPSTPRQGVAN